MKQKPPPTREGEVHAHPAPRAWSEPAELPIYAPAGERLLHQFPAGSGEGRGSLLLGTVI